MEMEKEEVCMCCNNITDITDLVPIKIDEEISDDFVCRSCLEDPGCDYGTCRYCEFNGDNVAYPVEKLSENDECPDHYGESVMEPDEKKGWEHNARRLQNI